MKSTIRRIKVRGSLLSRWPLLEISIWIILICQGKRLNAGTQFAAERKAGLLKIQKTLQALGEITSVMFL